MNNSDLSLDFLKKCQKCRENGVPNDMAILAALQDLADWKDQHPRKGLWDAEKVCKYLENHAGHYMTLENDEEGELQSVFYQKGLIEDLRKAITC